MSYKKVFSIISFSIFIIAPAYCDAGVPMIAIIWPGMWITFIPVIAIETFIIRRKLLIPLKLCIKSISISNFVTTLIGIPLTWIVLLLLEMLTEGGSNTIPHDTMFNKIIDIVWHSPWLMPYSQGWNWILPLATYTLFIPFFFISWFIEYFINKKIIGEQFDNKILFKITRTANIYSYIFLIVISGIFFLFISK